MSRHNGTWAASEIGIKLVRETIHNKGWTQNRLVQEVGQTIYLSPATLTRFLRGENIKSDVFQVICNVLKLNIERVRKTPASNFSGEKQETETKSVVKGFYSDLHTTQIYLVSMVETKN